MPLGKRAERACGRSRGGPEFRAMSPAAGVAPSHAAWCARVLACSRGRAGSSPRVAATTSSAFPGASERTGRRPRSVRSHAAWRAPRRASRVSRAAGTDIVLSDTCDEDDEECKIFEIGPDGRLAEPLEAAIPADYYSLLQLDFDASDKEVKSQYRQLQKWCHPDIAGEAGTEVCIILNEAYDTLMDAKEREVYDRDLKELQQLANMAAASGGGDFKPYTGQPLSTFCGSDPSGDQRAVFVNESACIGCRQCNHSAPNTFMMEDDWGRARAFQQWADDEEDINIAIESCPVDCIYFVKQRNLPILEYAMQRCERASAGARGGARGGEPAPTREETALRRAMDAMDAVAWGERGETWASVRERVAEALDEAGLRALSAHVLAPLRE